MIGTSFAASGVKVPRVVPHPVLGFWCNPEHPSYNSVGLRGDENMLGDRTSDSFRVLVLGDSIAYPPEGLVRRFESGLRARTDKPVEVINAAIHGYTTYQERLYLEHALPKLDVDLVVLQYCLNDNYDFLHLITESGSMLLTLEAKSHLFPDDKGVLAALTRSSYLVYGVRKTLYQRSQTKPDHPWEDRIFGAAWQPATWTKQREHLSAMASILSERKVEFAVVAVPHEDQLDATRRLEHPNRVDIPQTELRLICDGLEVPCLDLTAEFLNADDTALYTDRIHLTERGHQVAGDALLEFLRGAQLVPMN